MSRRVAIVGGGWAGLAAAVASVQRGHRTTLFEMAGQLGGRARQVDHPDWLLDNGQHILIGAYSATLGLMRTVGVDPGSVLLRTPLTLVGPDGVGLRLPEGSPAWTFALAVARHARWPWRDKLGLLRAAAAWNVNGFRCDGKTAVAALTRNLSPAVKRELIEPLCVAALNTPASEASAQVFLRVLRDALKSGRGSADLLLPRKPLRDLIPSPVQRWLLAREATLHLHTRVQRLARRAGGAWQVDDQDFDDVILATTASEAARLVVPIDPAWSATARALPQEPIVTVYVHWPGARLRHPMLTLPSDTRREPAQFVFDQGQISEQAGLLSMVISGAQSWVELGTEATANAALAQIVSVLGASTAGQPKLVRVLTEKRATFRCTASLPRPPSCIAPGLFAAGDHVQGPYPATLEGAVRSGQEAVARIG